MTWRECIDLQEKLKDNAYISKETWIKNRQKQYFEINKTKYILRALLIVLALCGVGYAGIKLKNIDIAFSIFVLLPPIYVMIPLESKWSFIEHTLLILKEHSLVIYRKVGKTHIPDEMGGPFEFYYKDIDSVDEAEDRIVIKLKDNSAYAYKLFTLQNNFEDARIIERIRRKVNEHTFHGKI